MHAMMKRRSTEIEREFIDLSFRYVDLRLNRKDGMAKFSITALVAFDRNVNRFFG
jgi:hypothetical protein